MTVKNPHALVIPYQAQGHVIPLLELSYCLIDHGFRITFVNTEFTQELTVASMGRTNAGEASDLQIRLVKITDGMAVGENRSDVCRLCRSLLNVVPGALEALIGRINEFAAAAEYGKITCVIADGSMPWAVSVARKMEIPNAAFCPASVGCLAYSGNMKG